MTSAGVRALELAAVRLNTLYDSTVRALTRIRSQAGVNCVRSLTSNNYNIDSGVRAEICSLTQSQFANGAIDAAARTYSTLYDSTLQALATISNRWAEGCVRAFTQNGYSIDSGRRAQICSTFCSSQQVETLKAMTRAGQTIYDSTLESIARIR
jgi:hypothetical protein